MVLRLFNYYPPSLPFSPLAISVGHSNSVALIDGVLIIICVDGCVCNYNTLSDVRTVVVCH